jgi:flavin-dependent dehydrogenase
MAARRNGSRAVVMGASIAGLCAARVLAERFDSVCLVERDPLPPAPAPRRGTPQVRHAHALLVGGAQRFEAWFPGLAGELRADGALPIDRSRELHWYQAGGLRRAPRPGASDEGTLCSRPLLEHHLRRRVLERSGVALREAAVEDLLFAADGRSVTGVRLEGGEAIPADLVVDATGRAACSLRWLEARGFEAPARSEVRIDMGYATRILRAHPRADPGWRIGVVVGDPPALRMAVAFALEGPRWMVTLAGFHGDHAPTDDAGWLAFARSLPDPAIAELIAACEPLGEVVTHRMRASQRRHVEALDEVAGGIVLLGDAVASFNPVYGQGMTSAALQAEALARALDRAGELGPRFVRHYHRLAARAVETPWRMSVGADFSLPRTTGPRPRGSAWVGRYMQRVIRAAQRDAVVSRRLLDVGQLVRPPSSLLAPGVVLRVARATWQQREACSDESSRPRAGTGHTLATGCRKEAWTQAPRTPS